MTELVLGTKKGLFVLDGESPDGFTVTARAFAGEPIDFAIRDPRTGRLFAAATNPFYGPKIFYAEDPTEEWEQADGVALPSGGEEALEAAGSVRDLARLGRTYHGLSIAYQERGDLGRAVEFTHKALALYSLEHDTALLGRGENELGLLLMRQGKMARAEEAFQAALDHFDESGTERAKSHVLISLADLQLKTGRLKEASDAVKQAIELGLRLDERIALGDAHELLGRIYEQMGKRRLADKEFASAITFLDGEGLEQRLAESHAAFAEVLESRGQSMLARKHWKHAANLALQREGAGARILKAL